MIAHNLTFAFEISEGFQGNVNISAELDSWQTSDREKAPTTGVFAKVNKDVISFPYSNKATWLRFKLSNPTAENKNLIVYFDSSLGGEIDLFLQAHELKHLAKSGSSLRYNERSIPSTYAAFKISLPPKSEQLFLLKRSGVHQFNGSLFVADEKTFESIQSNKFVVIYLYIGALAGLLIYNFFIGIYTKSREYFLYSGFIFFMGGTVLNLIGGLDLILIEVNPSNYLMMFSAGTVVFSIAFTTYFLNILDYYPRFKYINYAFYILGTSHFILYPIVPYNMSVYMGYSIDASIILVVITMLVMGIRAMFRGSILARFYVLSWGVLFISVFVWMAMTYGLLPENIYLKYSILWGNLFEMFVISLGLAYRIVSLDREKKAALIRVREQEKYRLLLRTIIHDIGNPLNLVIHLSSIVVEQMKTGEDCDVIEKNMNKVERAALSISEIITSVRSQEVQAPIGEKFEITKVSLEKVVDDCLFIFDKHLKDKNIAVKKPERYYPVKANESLLKYQVISNLLSNAIKFSDADSVIEIDCQIEDHGDVCLSIHDYGVGLSDQQIEEFNQKGRITSTTGTGGEKGIGYGMMLVKSNVELFDGSVHVETVKGGAERSGTLVRLRLKAY